MRELQQKCSVCQDSKAKATAQDDFFQIAVDCEYCGKYTITENAVDDLCKMPVKGSREIANARGWLRENRGIKLDERGVQTLRTLKTPNVAERAEKLFVAMSRYKPSIGETLSIGKRENLSKAWIAFSWSVNSDELRYLLREYLTSTKEWLTDLKSPGEFMEFVITPKGHDFLDSIRLGSVGGLSGFCAMWFSSEVTEIWMNAIKPAIELAGYRSVRIDGVEHNNKIDDEILANIRNSRFVVADFTGERGGVYFEAGFAMGLGLPVIWTVREDSLPEIHFDNRQYNFILWKPDDLPDFAKRLQLRIEATIGKGPVIPE